MIRNIYSSPSPIVYVDSSTESESPSPITASVSNDDASSPEPDHSPIIAFATNEDIDDDPRSESLPVADFIPEEDVDSGPTSDSSSLWQWPENQLGLPQSNLDNEGEIKHHETIMKY
jgi:hypothetical protein